MVNTREQLVKGAVYGMAYGDAWGNVTEFMNHKQILKDLPASPEELVITDDTQMSIYNVLAMNEILHKNINLTRLGNDVTVQNQVRKIFANHHGDFFLDPDNNRAPGVTCMTSLEQYLRATPKVTGREGNTNYSNGCGTVMRAPWLGLYDLPRETIILLAVLQAQTTHGDPSGWVSSAIAALTMKDLLENQIELSSGSPNLIYHALELLDEIRGVQSNLVDECALGLNSIRLGLNKCLTMWVPFIYSDGNVDVNKFFGEGWVADQALFNALAVVSLYADEPLSGIERLVYTNGDSDSIAAIGGAFFGAIHGVSFLDDVEVESRLEPRYKKELADIVSHLS